jgi:hypothetical protein
MFDRKSWGAFRSALVRTVTQLDPGAVIDDAAAMIELTLDRATVRLGMKDVAAACAGNDPATFLAEWRDDVLAQIEGCRVPETFDEAVPLLRVQMYSDATRPPIANQLAPGLWLAAVVDLPDAIVPVLPELVKSWAVPVKEMLEPALLNMEELPLPSFDGTHAPVLVAHGDEYLAATAYTRLVRLIGDTPHGALVTFPCRSSLLFLPLWDMPSDVALRRMVLATDKLFEGADDPLSRELYWCTPDIELVVTSPVRVDGGLMFMWPPGLDELLPKN